MQQSVKDYYGKTLSASSDLKTDACCTVETQPPWMAAFLENVRPEVRDRYYGCGLVAPLLLDGARVLDLGCGAGRDVYLLSQAVGASGEVIGVDMTPEQLAVAKRWQDAHAEKFGFENVRFLEGDIERAIEADFSDQQASPSDVGKASRLEDALGRYIEFIKQSFPKHKSLAGLKIVVDCAHGAAYKCAPQVLWELEAEVFAIGT
ncbi:MAG: methyltransferase domain-containing protein, partial [Pseudomonadota bacterium]